MKITTALRAVIIALTFGFISFGAQAGDTPLGTCHIDVSDGINPEPLYTYEAQTTFNRCWNIIHVRVEDAFPLYNIHIYWVPNPGNN